MIRLLAAIAMAATACTAIMSAHAEDQNRACLANGVTQDECSLSKPVVVTIGQVSPAIRLSKPFKNARLVGVGGPRTEEVVSIEPLTDTSFFLLGRVAGRTNILFYDDQNMLIKNLDVIVKNNPNRVVIFNIRPQQGQGAGAGSTTGISGRQEFQCSPVGCEFIRQSHYETATEKQEITHHND